MIDDGVLNAGVYSCTDMEGKLIEGYMFNPEMAAYDNGNSLPYRVYRLAVPGNERPSVSVTDVKTVPLNKPFCKGATIKYSGTQVAGPFFKDGLWMVDVLVPLYVKRGSSPFCRMRTR